MELNRYPQNYYAEVEQAAFSPANAKTHKHNPFDVTKVWPKGDYPPAITRTLRARRPSACFTRQRSGLPARVLLQDVYWRVRPLVALMRPQMFRDHLATYGSTLRSAFKRRLLATDRCVNSSRRSTRKPSQVMSWLLSRGCLRWPGMAPQGQNSCLLHRRR